MIILASNSPRRKQLLALAGWEYQVLASTVDESTRLDEAPQAYVIRLAQEKAQAALELIPPANRPAALVVSADTAVVDQGVILGKPTSASEAAAMLRRLRGRFHQVYTGLAVLRPAAEAGSKQDLITDVVTTDVGMRSYSEKEIQAYVESGDPLDKAGAYAIQNAEFHPVQNLQGCYANVMGLPLCRLVQMLARFGLQPQGSITQACQQAINQPCWVFLQASQAAPPVRGYANE